MRDGCTQMGSASLAAGGASLVDLRDAEANARFATPIQGAIPDDLAGAPR